MALFIAAIFAAVACFVPEARWESLAASFLLVAVALLGIPLLTKVISPSVPAVPMDTQTCDGTPSRSRRRTESAYSSPRSPT
jgi:hypothetical protein